MHMSWCDVVKSTKFRTINPHILKNNLERVSRVIICTVLNAISNAGISLVLNYSLSLLRYVWNTLLDVVSKRLEQQDRFRSRHENSTLHLHGKFQLIIKKKLTRMRSWTRCVALTKCQGVDVPSSRGLAEILQVSLVLHRESVGLMSLALFNTTEDDICSTNRFWIGRKVCNTKIEKFSTHESLLERSTDFNTKTQRWGDASKN